jgi:hypothetical protein
MRRITLGLAALGLSTVAVLAQTPTSFADVDTDANGELSFAELQVVWPDLTEAEFAGADADGSGGLGVDELNTLQPSTLPATPEAAPEAPAQ